ncbi:SH3 domain-containing protein [Roseibium sp. SCPC15]|uniref:SH3 domain-containing protein n=1 Tax=Roseibium sp. SCP15 TaxID=3141376 RepID=UPI00333648D9
MKTFSVASVLMVSATAIALSPAGASDLDVPVMEIASDDLDTCALGKVAGLKKDGDGFLAVRSGPGTNFRKLDEIHNEDIVWLFEQKGNWIGIVYGVGYDMNCSAVDHDRPVPHRGKKGWVHENWIEFLAG